MTQYDNRGKVALWKNDNDNEQAPVLKGSVYAHRAIAEGEKLDISLWKNDNPTENAPVLRGQVSDPFKKTTAPQSNDRTDTNPPPFEDDDLPFSGVAA